MLDDGDGRHLGVELADELERCIRVVDVVVGEFLALQLTGSGDADLASIGYVKRRRLMCVLAVAQRLPEPAAEGSPLGRFGLEFCREPVADRRVIRGRARERLGREFFAKRQRRCAVVRRNFRKQTVVVLGLDDDRDALMVLCRCADHRRPADVDVLDALFVAGSLQNRRLEGIEIYDQQIDRRNRMLACGLVVLGVSADRQAARHARADAGSSRVRPSFPESQSTRKRPSRRDLPVFSAAAVPPVETISTPRSFKAVAKATSPVLSETERSALRMR